MKASAQGRGARRSARLTRPRAAIAGVALLAAVGLAGCSDQPGAAAYVGDHHISTAHVQEASNEVIAAAAGLLQVPLDPTEVNRRQVNRLVTEQLIAIGAERNGITVSEAEVDALLAQASAGTSQSDFQSQIAAAQLVPPSELRAFARAVALNQKLIAKLAPKADENAQSEAIVKELGALSDELGTGVSPRFGTWDAAQLSVALPPDDLSTPEPVRQDTQITTGDVRTD